MADTSVTSFWHDYWRVVQAVAPELGLSKPGPKPSGSTFIFFKPAGLPSRTLLVHKFSHGFADLEFTGCGDRMGHIQLVLGDDLPSGGDVVKISKSAALRVPVPKLDPGTPLSAQQDEVLECLGVVRALRDWAKSHREAIEKLGSGSAEG